MKYNKVTLIINFLVLIFSTVANASEKTGAINSLQTVPMVSQIITGLISVTAMIFFLAWVAKRLGAGSMLQQKDMKVVGSLILGTREKAVLLEVDNKKILVGVSSASISCLYVFNDTCAASETASNKPIETDNANQKWDFSHCLKKIIDKTPSNHL